MKVRRSIFAFPVVFLLNGMLWAGESGSHTITIRIIKPNQISIADQNPSDLKWKTNTSAKKITVSGSGIFENSMLQFQPLNGVGNFSVRSGPIALQDRELIQIASRGEGICRMEYRSAVRKPKKIEQDACKVVYTLTDY